MAIKWFNNDGVELETTHQHCVIGNYRTRTERVMSDIYADVASCDVWDAEDKQVRAVTLWYGFELNTKTGRQEADIKDGPHWDDYQDYLEKRRHNALVAGKAREAQALLDRAQALLDREKYAKDRLLTPKKGMKAKVVKGRKVPVGTIGTIFWIEDGGFGKCGLIDDKGAKHWSYLKNIECAAFGLDFGEEPDCGWTELERRINKAQPTHTMWKKIKARHPKKGTEGAVFYIKGDWIGFKKGRKGLATWGDIKELEVYCPNKKAWIPAYQDAPATTVKAKGKTEAKKVNGRGQEVTDKGLHWKHLPHPMCDIAELKPLNNGLYKALDINGEDIMELPTEGFNYLMAEKRTT